ncbi:MAG: glycosyltransferase family 2 protein [Acidobacteriia bacterium]|nr:glycosyltransferase family 2 protein [Terriglobia bacterium]
MILISVVIPNYSGAACLEPCLQSLMRQTYLQMEVVVVDNASQDHSVELVRRVAPHARILSLQGNLGFAAAVNRGVKAARGEWIAVLNNDTEAANDWLAECAAAIGRHPDASFLACRILDYSNRKRIYSAGDCFLRAGIGYRRGQEKPDGEEYGRETQVFSACGCAALYRRTALEAAGGYDEQFFAYLEDVDLGLRLQAAGARGYYVPGAVVFHLGGATSGGEFAPLAVRLRTRNAVLLLLKSVPGRILWRCSPMILAGQAFWFGRVLVRGRLWSYLRGLAGAITLAPAMLRHRRGMCGLWKSSGEQLWRSILESENLARRDYSRRDAGRSHFLAWYFRLF